MLILRSLPVRYHRLAAALTLANWTTTTQWLPDDQVLILHGQGPAPFEVRASWSARPEVLSVEDALGSKMNMLTATRYILDHPVVE